MATDRIYNIASTALPGSGQSSIGNKLDLVGTYTYSKSFNIQLGYFWFFFGDAVDEGSLARSDAEPFYLQATYSFGFAGFKTIVTAALLRLFPSSIEPGNCWWNR